MSEELRPYRAYKESGVSWLGPAPAHWWLLPGRACLREKKTPNTGLHETTVLSLSYGRIVVKSADKLHGLVPASFETYQIVEPGDIICRPTDLQNDWNSLRFGISQDRGIITSAYLCFQTQSRLSHEFGYLMLHTYDLKKVFYGLGSGLRQNLDWQDFKYLPCVVPPREEQSAIVRYLDHADRRIGRYIRAKLRMIELLNEQKQAIIQRAVTRGLDPNVRLKSSGIDWLGEVPEHWDLRPAKRYFREVDERSQNGEEELLSVSHITGVTPRSQKTVTMFRAASYSGHKLCRSGDLVVNSMWTWMGALGVARQVGLVSPSYAVYRPICALAFIPEYVDLLLRTKPYISEYICRSTGIRPSRLRVYPDQFLRIPLALPPAEEQVMILNFVANETKHLDNNIQRAQREIDLLREYRTRLIADVVTGKVDVRELAASLPDAIDDESPGATALAEETDITVEDLEPLEEPAYAD